MHVSTFCAASCLLERFSRDGEVGPSGSEVELSHRVYSTVLRLPGGAETRLSYAWSVEDAWSGDGVRGVYRLAVLGQTTIRPTELRIGIRVPEGMVVARATPGMRIEGDRVSWEGHAVGLMRFEVEFVDPLPGGVWRTLVGSG
ncbi:MAG: hypothetical protein HY658_11260 [Actinobacteria bacterium]|nr:hypothetical protein [Actinomycetota bacterium]